MNNFMRMSQFFHVMVIVSISITIIHSQIVAAIGQIGAEPNGWHYVLAGILCGGMVVYFEKIAKGMGTLKHIEAYTAISMLVLVITITLVGIAVSATTMVILYPIVLVGIVVAHKVNPSIVEIFLMISAILSIAIMIVLGICLLMLLPPIIANTLDINIWFGRAIVIGTTCYSIFKFNDYAKTYYSNISDKFAKDIAILKDTSSSTTLLLACIAMLIALYTYTFT